MRRKTLKPNVTGKDEASLLRDLSVWRSGKSRGAPLLPALEACAQ